MVIPDQAAQVRVVGSLNYWSDINTSEGILGIYTHLEISFVISTIKFQRHLIAHSTGLGLITDQ